jgi:TPR repeat protein
MEDLMKRVIAILILSLAAPAMAGAQDLASLEHMRQAAEQGNTDAQLEMGILYEFGFNMPKNNVTALAWYLRAAEQGDALAVKRRDQLKSQMNPDEIAAADKLSSELVSRKPESTGTPPATQAPPAEMKPENADTPPAAQVPPAETPAPPP